MITSDYNFIDVDFFVEYRILEPVKYLYNSEEPEDILKNISQSCIRIVIASYDVDEVLTDVYKRQGKECYKAAKTLIAGEKPEEFEVDVPAFAIDSSNIDEYLDADWQ